MLKIRIKELKEGRNPCRIERPGAVEGLPGFEGLSGDLVIEKCGTTLRLKGILKFTARLECSRCLESSPVSFSQPVELFYRTGKLEDTHPGKEVELNADDLSVIAYRGGELDLWPEIREAMELALPMKPVCSPDCRGICPGCGRDLNREQCKCDRPGMDPRWEVLARLANRKPAARKKK
jgi:uncharacterized protein